jgi:SnoaL-like polyketide cyclase
MHILYASQVRDEHLNRDQSLILASLTQPLMSDGMQDTSHASKPKDFNSAQDWVTAFFDKGAEEVLGYYADDFVWEDIEFMQTITTKEDLYKAFVVFNNSGPDSPFGVHKFEVLSYDGAKTPMAHAQSRSGGIPGEFPPEVYKRYAENIFLGADFDYDEWGYMQWIWKATHNEDFFGIPAAGKTTYTRGTTTQFYRDGKIVRCRTHWNFREFAMQLGVIPFPDEAWRNNPGLPQL